ncbi:LytR/AlgR family response regulator transcription factor [Anaeromicropila herbilytica]|uniref:Stage 0 sporulation protein A homolog n=1 Tax=Anaeromicropila herbilytica TaxID=2785025 RepID=A0A7R7EHU2_9FIRM|nr:LytTR family DNA-binding domain-containing protein [Anaeromicropila herbilytica]BCN29126.1 DNA-binding response regulator [Anaeromicropila herbilytica]
MAIKVLLVEDEDGIRLLLRKIIERNEGFEIVGESDNLADAVSVFTKTKADVVFLDIEIHGTSGLDCAKIIADLDPKTKIIFATAHPEYRSDAFEVYAFDYIMKPFNVERVNHTLDRIKSLTEPEHNDHLDKIIKFEKGLERLLVKGKESMSFVDIKDIILVQRENSNTVIYTKHDSFTTSASLSDIEVKLDEEQFLRSHKSYLINISQIKKIEPYGRWTYIVTFKDIDKDALMTSEKYEDIKKRFL